MDFVTSTIFVYAVYYTGTFLLIVHKTGARTKFDFINIDIEGLDLEVISEIDFSRFRPYVICFECGRDGVFPPTEVANLLEKNGYRHLFSSGPSHAFALAN
ncbi:FkbM family methyltransferase [Cylindrospermopsis raciborskii]|uniref:FkbM family methyltransferase n=1 Tax=Cylindrospermopsis raciborskii TaxID=77022 RepID=UPI003DA554C2